MKLTDKLKNLGMVGVTGLALAVGSCEVQGAPKVYIKPASLTVHPGDNSTFDVYIDSSGGERIFSMDVNLVYSNENLKIDKDKVEVLEENFWSGKTLDYQVVDGHNSNIIFLQEDESYSNYITKNDAAFRVYFTAGQNLGRTDISFNTQLGYNAQLLAANPNPINPPEDNIDVYQNERGGKYLEVSGSSIDVVPEPSSLAFLGAGLLGLRACSSRKKK